MTNDLIRRMPWSAAQHPEAEPLLSREWLVANGLGGYASGTIAGVATRRYHGLLIAALPAPLGRLVMLSHVWEQVRLPDGQVVHLGGEEHEGGSLDLPGAVALGAFRLESGLPVWRFHLAGGLVIERRVYLPNKQNTVYLRYRLVEGEGTLRLKVRPALNCRPLEAPVSTPLRAPYALTALGDRYEVQGGADIPPLRLFQYGQRGSFTVEGRVLPTFLYRWEERRGYQFTGQLWSPGHFRADLSRDHDTTLLASTEEWEMVLAIEPDDALRAERERRQRLLAAAPTQSRQGAAAELVLAADQFLITPAGRIADAARAHAAGDEVRTVIAGYHWFTDWGRDTMISLEGLTLSTGRHAEAGYILRTFAHYIRDGLIPNMFPDGEQTGLYNTADASLWFFHAIARYLAVTGDRRTLRLILPRLEDIVAHHVRGTLFGIHVDPTDGLLSQGAEGYQLTWMDAKVGDWVVTPRRGKAVEINALWYNALCLLAGWVAEEQGEAAARRYREHAERARRSFNARFWYPEGGYLYDVVDQWGGGNDPSCRPNQVFAISLPHPVLDEERWRPVLGVVRDKLLTPVGLRSLAPDDPDFKSRYYGDLRARDAAYHQGTVWAWLIGPYVDAWLKVHPSDYAGARAMLGGLLQSLDEAGIGQISEIFDAEPPYTPRGCIAQAWSVAETLRAWLETAPSVGGDLTAAEQADGPRQAAPPLGEGGDPLGAGGQPLGTGTTA